MNDLIKSLNKKLKKLIKFLNENRNLIRFINYSLALSTVSLFSFLFFRKRKPDLLLSFPPNIGYLRLIKPQIYTYNKFFHNLNRMNNNPRLALALSPNFIKFVRHFYSIPNGLTNYGTNCFINVLLQCLASNPDFIQYTNNINIYNCKMKKDKMDEFQIAKGVSEVLEQINSANSVISAYELINTINKKYEFEYDHQDPYELYHRLLEIYEDIVTTDKSPHIFKEKNPFSIELESKLKCENCSNVIKKKEDLLDLSLHTTNKAYSVTSMLESYFSPCKISDYICSKCTVLDVIDQVRKNLIKKYDERLAILRKYLTELSQGNVDDDSDNIFRKIQTFCEEKKISQDILNLTPIKTTIAKSSEIIEYPKIMTIHISRVGFHEYAFTNKKYILFPEILKFKDKSTERVVSYELTSLIEHLGEHNFGHYVAYRKFLNKWVFMNDSRAVLVDKSKAVQVPNPYMLFYRIAEDKQ